MLEQNVLVSSLVTQLLQRFGCCLGVAKELGCGSECLAENTPSCTAVHTLYKVHTCSKKCMFLFVQSTIFGSWDSKSSKPAYIIIGLSTPLWTLITELSYGFRWLTKELSHLENKKINDLHIY